MLEFGSTIEDLILGHIVCVDSNRSGVGTNSKINLLETILVLGLEQRVCILKTRPDRGQARIFIRW